MKRISRPLFALFTAASLLVSVAACALWAISCWRQDIKMWKHGRGQRSLSSVLGGIRYLSVDYGYTVRPEHEDFGWYFQPIHSSSHVDRSYGSRSRTVSLAGFHYIEGDWRQGFAYPGEPAMPYRVVVVPYWLIAAVGAAPAGWRAWGFARRRRRRRAGRCVACGYDCRASSGRCPECGNPIPT